MSCGLGVLRLGSGLVLGGNPSSRHATTIGVPISRMTLLHRVRTGAADPVPPVTVRVTFIIAVNNRSLPVC